MKRTVFFFLLFFFQAGFAGKRVRALAVNIVDNQLTYVLAELYDAISKNKDLVGNTAVCAQYDLLCQWAQKYAEDKKEWVAYDLYKRMKTEFSDLQAKCDVDYEWHKLKEYSHMVEKSEVKSERLSHFSWATWQLLFKTKSVLGSKPDDLHVPVGYQAEEMQSGGGESASHEVPSKAEQPAPKGSKKVTLTNPKLRGEQPTPKKAEKKPEQESVRQSIKKNEEESVSKPQKLKGSENKQEGGPEESSQSTGSESPTIAPPPQITKNDEEAQKELRLSRHRRKKESSHKKQKEKESRTEEQSPGALLNEIINYYYTRHIVGGTVAAGALYGVYRYINSDHDDEPEEEHE